jgi:glycosyltransferase involved in cell wall biosynthesis
MPDTRDRAFALGSDHATAIGGGRVRHSRPEHVQVDRRLFPVPVEPPLVSIIVTAHNYGRFIADCLNSVFAQTYPRIECIVVDDCSDDDTPTIVDGLLGGWNDPRFSYHRLPRNLGQLGAQVEGFDRSEGEFVVFLDADDLLFPGFVGRHLFVHHNIETPVGFTSSDQWTITADGQLLAKHHTDLVSRLYSDEGVAVRVEEANADAPDGAAPVDGLLFPFWMNDDHSHAWLWGTQSTMMYRRTLLGLILPRASAGLDAFRTCADFYLVRLGQLIGGSFVFREALGCYRRHGSNNFTTNGIIAARMQTGDMRNHPTTEAFKALALQVLADRKDAFASVLGGERFDDITRFIRGLRADTFSPAASGSLLQRLWTRLVAREGKLS